MNPVVLKLSIYVSRFTLVIGLVLSLHACNGSLKIGVVSRNTTDVPNDPEPAPTTAETEPVNGSSPEDQPPVDLDPNPIDPVASKPTATNEETVAVEDSPVVVGNESLFEGIDFVKMIGSTTTDYVLTAQWNKLSAGATYQLYASTSENGFDYSVPLTVLSQVSDRHVVVSVPRSNNQTWFNLRAVDAAGKKFSSTRMFLFSAASGTVARLNALYRWTGEGRSDIEKFDASAIAADPWGNQIIGDRLGIISVYCLETQLSPYCRGREPERIYTIAGYDGNEDGPDNTLALWTPLGQVENLAVDAGGNIFIGDGSYYRLRAICIDPALPGFCSGKSKGNVYRVAGDGTNLDGPDNVAYVSAAIGRPSGLKILGQNIILGDTQNFRIRLLCINSEGVCAGKTAGNVYHLAGTGASLDGADGIAVVTAIGNPHDIQTDRNGNIVFGDTTYNKIKTLCLNSTGICAGKTAGSLYAIAGNGTVTDGADNQPAISPIGTPAALRSDDNDNIYITDSANGRIRIYCQNVIAAGICNGKTQYNIYHVYGDGLPADAADDLSASAAGIGAVHRIEFLQNGLIFLVDKANYRIRFICENTSSSLCGDKTAGNVYHLFNGVFDYGSPVFINQYRGTPYSMAFDKKNNMYLAVSVEKRMKVLCLDPTALGTCFQKAPGFLYTFAGNGVEAVSGDDVPAITSTLEEVRGITVDSAGNVYLAEYRGHWLTVVCINTAVSSGPCVGKTAGNLYHLMGNNTEADGGFDIPSQGVAVSYPQTVLLDHLENVYLSNFQTKTRVRVICYNVTEPGFCFGRTVGNTYNFLGNATASCGANADGTDSTVAGTCKNYGMNFDTNGNLLLASYHSQGRIDAVCSRHDSGKGVCEGKVAGAFYRVGGAGTLADDPTGPALTSRVCRGRGIAPDPYGNVYFEDYCNATRVLCSNDTAPGFCKGKTVGTLYRWFGSTGNGGGIASGSSFSGLIPASVGGTGSMIFDSHGLLYMQRSGAVLAYFP